MSRSIRDRINVPPSELHAALPKPIAAGLAELARLREQDHVAHQALTAAEAAIDAAAKQDTQAAADAIRAAKAAPDRKATAAAEKKLAAAKGKAEAIALAVGDAERDLEQAIGKDGAAAREKLLAQVDATHGECLKAAEAVASRLAERQGTFALASWLEAPTSFGRFGGRFGKVTNLRAPSGDPLSVDTILAELIAAFSPPEPKVSNPAQRLPSENKLRRVGSGGR